jgi:hypothetical protein
MPHLLLVDGLIRNMISFSVRDFLWHPPPPDLLFTYDCYCVQTTACASTGRLLPSILGACQALSRISYQGDPSLVWWVCCSVGPVIDEVV